MKWLILAAAMLAAAVHSAPLAAQTPPMRTFGTVTINGQSAPAGTVVQAIVAGGKVCGEGQVRRVNDALPLGYVVDVISTLQTEGCAGEGDRISFKVGGVDANETAEFATGVFLRLDLSVSAAVQTPAPSSPTPPPFGTPAPVPASATPAATAPASATAAATPAGSATPAATATAGASATPPGTATATATATPTSAPSGTAARSATVAATAPSGTPAAGGSGGNGGGGGSGAAVAAVVIVLLAAAGAGAYWYLRRRPAA